MKNVDVNNNNNLGLSPQNQVKPAGVQYRLLRRIVEKRLAQANHKRSKEMVPSEMELIYLEKELDDSQIVHIFASRIDN